MSRKLFCEISPTTYKISLERLIFQRRLKDFFSHVKFAEHKSETPLKFTVYKHASLIRRVLGDVDPDLQNNKAVNLSLAAPKINGIMIRPGETFSFWHLVGRTSAKKGYLEGLTIAKGVTGKGIGGGMCQFSNLIHWMVLHSPLTITEHHHHDGYDLFPDYGRKIPFGTGSAVGYNYIDYRFRNDTDATFQLLVYTDDNYLHGRLLCDKNLEYSYHIHIENERFVRRDDGVYRLGTVYRDLIEKRTGNVLKSEVIKENNAKLLYEISEDKISKESNESNENKEVRC